MISVIIPTFKTPQALDLCLRSVIEGQEKLNEILVVVDGTLEVNTDVLSKYYSQIHPVVLPNNVGMTRAQNLGVSLAKNKRVLITNDDNVFPKEWDTILGKLDVTNSVIAPNQIEPYNSMFSQFIIKDCGKDPAKFDLEGFWKFEKSQRKDLIEDTGSTYPIYMSRLNYMSCGGFDIEYPTLTGSYTDWDFFLKCELNGWKMLRTYECAFYHFVSVSRKSTEAKVKEQSIEAECKKFFATKWQNQPKHNPINNSKMI
jgi:glycosyltransferase involved in cell wall biosynthesis